MGFQEKDAPSRWRYLRPTLFGIWMFFITGLTISELGIVSAILQRFGNDDSIYPSAEFKHDLGIILFSCIVTLLFIISHPWSSVFMATICAFILAVFWGTAAGVIFHTTPFEFYTCHRPDDYFAPEWRPWISRCPQIVAMQGMAWSLWGFFLFMLVGFLVQLFECKRRPHVKGFYEV